MNINYNPDEQLSLMLAKELAMDRFYSEKDPNKQGKFPTAEEIIIDADKFFKYLYAR